MTEQEAFNALWGRSQLLFDDNDRQRLKGAVVGIAGVGGVGCIIVEMLARTGVGSLRLADPDTFESSNLNRQLFATLSTLGQNKAQVAKERVHEINPYCKVTVYPQGINKQNVHEFVRGADVVYAQTDTMSPQILLDRVGRELHVPILKGSRAGYPGNRWEVSAHLWDYRDGHQPLSREEQNELFSKDLSWDQLTDEVLNEIDRQVSRRMKERLSGEIRSGKTELFGGSVQPEYLQRHLDDPNLCAYTICAPIANMGGILGAAEGLKIILGWQNKIAPVNLLR